MSNPYACKRGIGALHPRLYVKYIHVNWVPMSALHSRFYVTSLYIYNSLTVWNLDMGNSHRALNLFRKQSQKHLFENDAT